MAVHAMVEHVVGVALGRRGQPWVRAERSARAQLVYAGVDRRARIVCARRCHRDGAEQGDGGSADRQDSHRPFSHGCLFDPTRAAVSANKLYSLSTRKKVVFTEYGLGSATMSSSSR